MPRLNRLLKLIEPLSGWNNLVEELRRRDNKKIVCLNSARPYIIAALYESLKIPVLLVTAQPENAKKLQEQLLNWCRNDAYLFPEQDILPYERLTIDTATEIERIKVLSVLAEYGEGERDINSPLVVASVSALMSRTTAQSDFIVSRLNIKLGITIEPFRLMTDFQNMGYRLENIVEMPGVMSHRGGIIDIFPPTAEKSYTSGVFRRYYR